VFLYPDVYGTWQISGAIFTSRRRPLLRLRCLAALAKMRGFKPVNATDNHPAMFTLAIGTRALAI